MRWEGEGVRRKGDGGPRSSISEDGRDGNSTIASGCVVSVAAVSRGEVSLGVVSAAPVSKGVVSWVVVSVSVE